MIDLRCRHLAQLCPVIEFCILHRPEERVAGAPRVQPSLLIANFVNDKEYVDYVLTYVSVH